jgi:putative colanic acid biosynthesis acetyltransferase WcaF
LLRIIESVITWSLFFDMIILGNDPYTQPSFGLMNRVARAIWMGVWLLLFRFSPRPLHTWRSVLLRLFGAKIGKSVHVYPRVSIWAPWQLTLGDRVGIANDVTLYNMAPITIEANAVISQGAHLCAGSHDIDSPNLQLITAPIHIGSYAWVCAEAFVGPGVEIAEGCVLGARGVAMRSLTDSWTVWSGNPVVKRRTRKKSQIQGISQ